MLEIGRRMLSIIRANLDPVKREEAKEGKEEVRSLKVVAHLVRLRRDVREVLLCQRYLKALKVT